MKYLWLLLTIAFTSLIFYCSSMPGSESGGMSKLLLQYLQLLAPIMEVPTEHTIRKLAHFTEFSILGLLLWKTMDSFKLEAVAASGYILLLGLLVAVVDEYIQSFSPGRSSQVSDVLLDFSGVLCTWLWLRICSWARE